MILMIAALAPVVRRIVSICFNLRVFYMRDKESINIETNVSETSLYVLVSWRLSLLSLFSVYVYMYVAYTKRIVACLQKLPHRSTCLIPVIFTNLCYQTYLFHFPIKCGS